MKKTMLKLEEDQNGDKFYVGPEVDRTIRPSDPTKDPINTIRYIRIMTGFGLTESKSVVDYMKLVQALAARSEDGRADYTRLNLAMAAARAILEY